MLVVLEKIRTLLEHHNIDFLLREHEPTPTSEDSARVRGESMSSGAKAIVYKVQNEFCLFVMAANLSMDTKKIKLYFKEQGKRVKKTRFANLEELENMTGLPPGAVPPFGQPILPFDLYVDPSLLKNENISFNAGSLRHSITMHLNDYIGLVHPTVFHFTATMKINK